MKKMMFACSLLVLALGLSAQTLKLAAIEAVKPFEPLLAKVIKSAGFTPEFTYLPQARLMADADSYDAVYFLTDIAITSVKGMVKVPVPLFSNDVVAVAAKPDVKVASRADLAKYKVGVERGNKNHQEITKGVTGIVETDNQAAAVKMLGAGRFDVAIVSRSLVAQYAKEAGLAKYYVQEPPVLQIPLYLGLTAKGAANEAKLTPAFRKVVDDGSWLKDATALAPK